MGATVREPVSSNHRYDLPSHSDRGRWRAENVLVPENVNGIEEPIIALSGLARCRKKRWRPSFEGPSDPYRAKAGAKGSLYASGWAAGTFSRDAA
jgi:hypothetical protein